MTALLPTILAAITAFAATNVDDILLLTVYFAQVNTAFRKRHIILGQYVGFAAILAVSTVGLLGALIIPPEWIGLLGLLPIFIGLRRLFSANAASGEENMALPAPLSSSPFASLFSPYTYSVAAVTFANGGDNISIYVPLFAAGDFGRALVMVGVFAVLIALWCYLGYRLARSPLLTHTLTRYGHILIPLLLIALGIYIMFESNTLSLIG